MCILVNKECRNKFILYQRLAHYRYNKELLEESHSHCKLRYSTWMCILLNKECRDKFILYQRLAHYSYNKE